jgi:hypothetical protein
MASKSLIFLSQENLKQEMTNTGKLLLSSVSGLSIVLFYTTSCPYSAAYVDVFKKLHQYINGGCHICVYNIKTTNDSIQFVNGFITAVPTVILYYNGIPKYRYNNDTNTINPKMIVTFISDQYNELIKAGNTKQQQFVPKQQVSATDQRIGTASTTFGIPITGDLKDNVCYLIVDSVTGQLKCDTRKR